MWHLSREPNEVKGRSGLVYGGSMFSIDGIRSWGGLPAAGTPQVRGVLGTMVSEGTRDQCSRMRTVHGMKCTCTYNKLRKA